MDWNLITWQPGTEAAVWLQGIYLNRLLSSDVPFHWLLNREDFSAVTMYKKVDMGSMKYIHKRLLERHFIEMKTHDWLSEPTPLLSLLHSYIINWCKQWLGMMLSLWLWKCWKKKKKPCKIGRMPLKIKKAGRLVTCNN